MPQVATKTSGVEDFILALEKREFMRILSFFY